MIERPSYAATLETSAGRKPSNQIMKTKTNGKRQESLASARGSVALCATCKHYCGLKADEYGKCRRYPPTLSPLYGNSEYPNVGVNMTCGEYAPQNAPHERTPNL